jgi:hypothetical protein
MVQSTVADSIIAGLQLAAGTRLQDTDKLTAIASRKEAILNSRQERKQREALYPAELQEAEAKADTASYNLRQLPEQTRLERLKLKNEINKADLELIDATIKAAFAIPKAQAELDSSEATRLGTLATTRKANLDADQADFDNFEKKSAQASGGVLDEILLTNPNAIQPKEGGGLSVDGLSLLNSNPRAVYGAINLNNAGYFRTVSSDGAITPNKIVGINRIEEGGQVFYVPQVLGEDGRQTDLLNPAGKQAPMTKNATSSENDIVVKYTEAMLNGHIQNAMVYAIRKGAGNSTAWQAEGFRRLRDAYQSASQGEITVAARVVKDAIVQSPLPENVVRETLQNMEAAVLQGDVEQMMNYAESFGIGDEFITELAAEMEASGKDIQTQQGAAQRQAEDAYLDNRIDAPKNQYYQDPLAGDLSNDVDPPAWAAAAVQGRGGADAIQASMDESSAGLRQQNRDTLRRRMEQAGETIPLKEFTASLPALAQAMAEGEKILSRKARGEVEGFLNDQLDPGEQLTEQKFQAISQQHPDKVSGIISLFMMGAEDPLAVGQSLANLAERGATDYQADTAEDDSQAKAEFRAGELTKIRELRSENDDRTLAAAEEITVLLSSPDFNLFSNSPETAEFKTQMRRLILAADNDDSSAVTAASRRIARNTITDVVAEIMAQNGSPGFRGSAMDYFYRRRAPAQLGDDRFDRLIVSTDGVLGYQDPAGGDVVFEGGLTLGQASSIFGKPFAKKLFKSVKKVGSF